MQNNNNNPQKATIEKNASQLVQVKKINLGNKKPNEQTFVGSARCN
ncbi:hypothetical protein [Aeromonas hydrophila]|nr:hypothetical protein [Aeromonas hydrophila]